MSEVNVLDKPKYRHKFIIGLSMRWALIIKFLLLFSFAYPQHDNSEIIKVWFLYGSKPKYKYRKTEKRIFGGIHSGHVSVQLGNTDYGFQPTKKPVNLFPGKSYKRCNFMDTVIYANPRYPSNEKTAVVFIPVTKQQYLKLDSILLAYVHKTPYDYAVFGMRCSASAHEILAQIGILKKKSRFATVMSTFYPKRLRKRIFKLAKKHHWQILHNPGRKTRVWEKD